MDIEDSILLGGRGAGPGVSPTTEYYNEMSSFARGRSGLRELGESNFIYSYVVGLQGNSTLGAAPGYLKHKNSIRYMIQERKRGLLVSPRCGSHRRTWIMVD